MKNDFSDWLVVSDIDGTLNNKLRKMPKANYDAIDRFVNVLGGNFTLASARNVQSLKPHFEKLPGVKTPAIVMNGAGIYSFSKKEMLWFNGMNEYAREIVKLTLKKLPLIEAAVFTDDMIYLVKAKLFSPIMMMADNLNHIRCKDIDDVPEGNWGKIIFYFLPTMKKEVKAYVESVINEDFSLIDTSVASFDLLSATTNKGLAVLKVADMLNISHENTSAIGDYYNDIEMLMEVSHPACCAQAPKEVHAVSEIHACHCNKGAVAYLLNYIEKNY